jgi:hypothetical protein
VQAPSRVLIKADVRRRPCESKKKDVARQQSVEGDAHVSFVWTVVGQENIMESQRQILSSKKYEGCKMNKCNDSSSKARKM